MQLSIYDNYTGLERNFDFFAIDHNYHSCDMLLVCICQRGSASFKLNLHEVEVTKASFLFIAPGTPFFIIESSKDFHLDVLAIKDFATIIAGNDEYFPKLNRLLYQIPQMKISERQRCMAHILLSYMKFLLFQKKNENADAAKYTDEILSSYLKTMFLEICKILDENDKCMKPKTRTDVLAEKFFKSVHKYYTTNRNVSFYASELGISAKHLALVINKRTGKSPSDWINDFSLMQAKKYLRSGNKSVQEISYDLGFSSPSHFCKFFKDHTGMTPMEFSKAPLFKSE